ncbi:MAG: Nudix family hydrolase [Methyloprofundus sp.]|nr:Nudix family hydrolase [Methyloprofundus sp.]
MLRINVAVGVVRNDLGEVLISKRKAEAHQGGLWEFPGGKFEEGEGAAQALARELHEELNISPKSSSPLININFNYPECHVCLHVREVSEFEGTAIGREGQLFKWVGVSELSAYAFPEANKAILSALSLGRYYAIIAGENLQQIMCHLKYVQAQGVTLVQIRLKNLSVEALAKIIKEIRAKCEVLGLKYLFNSQMAISRTAEDGLHLTSFDLMSLSQRPDTQALVAASCHNLDELHQAESLGLDFAVLSPIMKTSSHPEAKVLGWEKMQSYIQDINMPVFALGGMTKQSCEKATNLGAQGVAGISLFLPSQLSDMK